MLMHSFAASYILFPDGGLPVINFYLRLNKLFLLSTANYNHIGYDMHFVCLYPNEVGINNLKKHVR